VHRASVLRPEWELALLVLALRPEWELALLVLALNLAIEGDL